MNLNNERNSIDKIFENHKPKIVEKDHVEKFYDGLIEDWGRGIWEFTDWKYKDLMKASQCAETLSALGIEQDDDMMGELRNEISKREESGQTEEEVEETTLATSGTPTHQNSPSAMKDEEGLIANASYYRFGEYEEDIPHGELDKQEELSDEDLVGFNIRPEDKEKVFYAYPEDIDRGADGVSVKNAYAVGSMIQEMKKLKGEK